jgi:hypothetical protein
MFFGHAPLKNWFFTARGGGKFLNFLVDENQAAAYGAEVHPKRRIGRRIHFGKTEQWRYVVGSRFIRIISHDGESFDVPTVEFFDEVFDQPFVADRTGVEPGMVRKYIEYCLRYRRVRIVPESCSLVLMKRALLKLRPYLEI